MLFGVLLVLASTQASPVAPSRSLAPALLGQWAPSCKAPFPLTRVNKTMQRNLERRIRAARLMPLVERKRLTIALVDLSVPKRLYYAALNGDEMLYAASLPKIAILLTAAEHANEGRLTWTAEHDRRMHSMIVSSNNPDTAWAGDQVGLEGIAEVLRKPRYCLYDEVHGGLWVGRHYRRKTEVRRDPLHNISHGATARQAARFYVLLDRGRLVNPKWSQRMLGLMSPPRITHKFVAGLATRPGVSFAARKSGTWRTFHSDSALIQHDNARYVAVVLADNKHGEKIIRQVIGILDDIIMHGEHRPKKRRVVSRR